MAVQIGPRLQIAELVMIAQRRGCILKTSSLRLVADDGSFLPIKYLYNPKTGGRLDLTDYEADDYMIGEEIKNASRRLGIPLP